MSESEEMYLITIAHLKEEGLEGPVPLSRLAEDLSVVSVSANQMVKKLAAAGLVRYLPYKGVFLTPSGHDIAARVLRHRRLWETFLVDHLGLEFSEADALACGMEHITTDSVAERLSAYLGDPTNTPGGKPIPGGTKTYRPQTEIPLSEVEVGTRGIVRGLDLDSRMQQFLASEGVLRGNEIIVLARGRNGSLLVESQGQHISLSSDITPLVLVHVSNGDGA